MGEIGGFTQNEIISLMSDDKASIGLANKLRIGLFQSPTQSNFRVIAILTILNEDGNYCLIKGSNSEQGYIGGAICAERAAICSLRFISNPVITHVSVVTDSENPVAPGCLCREYLTSLAQRDTIVVIGNAAGDHIIRTNLSELWPFPYVYRKVVRSDIETYTSHFEKNVLPAGDKFEAVFQAAVKSTEMDKADGVHPIRFAAAVQFEDNSVEVAWMLKGLEYGCTVDPVSQLISAMEKKKLCVPCSPAALEDNVSSMRDSRKVDRVEGEGGAVNMHQQGLILKPKRLVMCDQFGVMHAPFAAARSLLSEHGYNYVEIAVHDENGVVHYTTVKELIPQPGGTTLVSHDDFL